MRNSRSAYLLSVVGGVFQNVGCLGPRATAVGSRRRLVSGGNWGYRLNTNLNDLLLSVIHDRDRAAIRAFNESAGKVEKRKDYWSCGIETRVKRLPKLINGSSALMGKVFGDEGKHAQVAVSVSELPLNMPRKIKIVAFQKGRVGFRLNEGVILWMFPARKCISGLCI